MTDAVGTTEPSTSTAPRRFSPVTSDAGVTPVLYAGENLACALAETVFHDLSVDTSAPQEVLRSDLLTLRAGTIATTTDLSLTDLRDPALSAYGSSRGAVVDTPPAGYPTTRLLAQRVWDTTALSGPVWNSGGHRVTCRSCCSSGPLTRPAAARAGARISSSRRRRCRCGTDRDWQRC